MDRDRILVVEDDPDIRTILSVQLETAGYAVLTAEDGNAALRVLQGESVDLILLDVMMPGLNGYEVCKRIRSDRRNAFVPVIFLTARSAPDSRLEGLVGGANDYITKPYSREELLARVRNFITWSRAQRQCNPLTGLPGNPSIEAEVEGRLGQGAVFAFMYFDLDNFKAYNDCYSYMAGDGMIKLLARLLQEEVASLGNPEDFIGHVGGDDFVIITTPDRARGIARNILERFDREVLKHYRAEDRERGYVVVESRRGGLEKFPLVSLTVALVESDRHHIEHQAMLNDIVTELKQLGKLTPGSVVIEERRRTDTDVRTGSDG